MQKRSQPALRPFDTLRAGRRRGAGSFENVPRRTDMILEKLATDQLVGRMEINDLGPAMKSVNGAVNRLALGMLASSLIIGGGYVLGALIKRDAANRG